MRGAEGEKQRTPSLLLASSPPALRGLGSSGVSCFQSDLVKKADYCTKLPSCLLGAEQTNISRYSVSPVPMIALLVQEFIAGFRTLEHEDAREHGEVLSMMAERAGC